MSDLCMVLTFLSIIFSIILYLLKSFQRFEQEKQIFLKTSLASCLSTFEDQQKLFAEKLKQIVKLCSNKKRILDRKTELYRCLIEQLMLDLKLLGKLGKVEDMSDACSTVSIRSNRRKHRHVTFNPRIDVRYISTTGLAMANKTSKISVRSSKTNRLRRKRTKNSLISPFFAQANDLTENHEVKPMDD
ncbi:hypothetical protein M8J76_008402 [Diaphorina citri]|nr:hypothetical protein M8J75_013728 [Diaphorina citri]KAI5745122.1 hypothetical protein M8J76_008402 [Diaphorina citri]KAI5752279.1 hypothetical protein M8J77_015494 [Diaphorina citri]